MQADCTRERVGVVSLSLWSFVWRMGSDAGSAGAFGYLLQMEVAGIRLGFYAAFPDQIRPGTSFVAHSFEMGTSSLLQNALSK